MVEFSYGDCGQPCGATETDGDLLAKQLQTMVEHFCHDLKAAVTTGSVHGRRSSSMLSGRTQDALAAISDNPSPENVAFACRSFNVDVEWRCAD